MMDGRIALASFVLLTGGVIATHIRAIRTHIQCSAAMHDYLEAVAGDVWSRYTPLANARVVREYLKRGGDRSIAADYERSESGVIRAMVLWLAGAIVLVRFLL